MPASASQSPGSRLLPLFSDKVITTKNTLICVLIVVRTVYVTVSSLHHNTLHLHVCRLQVQLHYYWTSLHCNCNQLLATNNTAINTVMYCKSNWLVSITIQIMMITVVIASSLQLKFGGTCLAAEAVALLMSTFASLISGHHPKAKPKVMYNL